MFNSNDSNRIWQKLHLVILLILFLAGIPGIGISKTLNRNCKGAEMIKYEVNGKKYTHKESFRYNGTGTSKGAVPSPNKARQRACKSAAQKAADAANPVWLLRKICAKHPNSRGRWSFIGGIGSSKGVQKTHSTSGSDIPFDFGHEFRCESGRPYHRPVCGNGKKEGLEECDNGGNNSDTLSNACRTNCILADCGDGVTDSGEQCDDGIRNHNEIPGACRRNCKLPYCGDGVLDYDEGEKCDDGNNDPNDGCHQCRE